MVDLERNRVGEKLVKRYTGGATIMDRCPPLPLSAVICDFDYYLSTPQFWINNNKKSNYTYKWFIKGILVLNTF